MPFQQFRYGSMELSDSSERSARQFVKDIYSMLFAFTVETCNHRMVPSTKDAPPPPLIYARVRQRTREVEIRLKVILTCAAG